MLVAGGGQLGHWAGGTRERGLGSRRRQLLAMDLISVLISEANDTNMSLLLVARKADKQIDSEPDRDSERQRQGHRREKV